MARTVDLWFSSVGSGVVGKYADVPMEDHRRTIETNLITHMNDAHAVMPIFLEQDHGIWVNMISAGGFLAAPYAAAYSASKYGLRGLSEALRAELGKRPRIHICDMYPTFVDTPGLRHAANYTGARLNYPPGVLRPEEVAEAVVDLARRPRDSLSLGAPVFLLRLLNVAAPNLIAGSMNRFMDAWTKRADPAPDTRGALYEPQRGASGIRSGQWPPELPRNTALVVGAAALAAAVGVQLWRRR